MAEVRVNKITHRFPRKDGTFRVYVETRLAPRGKYRLKLSPEDQDRACLKIMEGIPLSEAALEFGMPLSTFTRLMCQLLLQQLRQRSPVP